MFNIGWWGWGANLSIDRIIGGHLGGGRREGQQAIFKIIEGLSPAAPHAPTPMFKSYCVYFADVLLMSNYLRKRFVLNILHICCLYFSGRVLFLFISHLGCRVRLYQFLSIFILTRLINMSLVKRVCVFEHSVMTNFNCACPAIQRRQGSGFLSEGSS